MVLSFSAVELRLVVPSTVLKVGGVGIPTSSGKLQVHMTPVSTLVCAFASILPKYSVSVPTTQTFVYESCKSVCSLQID